MFSRRALGIIALAAVVLAAVSFAVVDVSIANANGCIGVSGPCTDVAMPFVATIFASIGTIALLASVLPAMNWFASAMHHAHQDESESIREAVPATVTFDDMDFDDREEL